ncbi:hypothetical protein [Paenibacillus popilliae]|uniref:hypothetical protein n=1 Tax=Paenibacillus popilliae TaxID=78057 RepID=UPI00030064BC|nr:hypothetical protein [Paenibacillus popilliae]
MTKQEQRRQEWIARVAAYEASGQTMNTIRIQILYPDDIANSVNDSIQALS